MRVCVCVEVNQSVMSVPHSYSGKSNRSEMDDRVERSVTKKRDRLRNRKS